MRQFALACLIALTMPMTVFGSSLSEPFQSAIRAAEDRDYQALEEILDRYPELVNHAESPDCSLFCEFTRLLRSRLEGELTPGVDAIALQMLLDRGGNPALSPRALRRLLSAANVFWADVSEYPINSGVCTRNRDKMFPLANRLIDAGAPLDVLALDQENGRFTVGFFYTYQLCHKVFVCGTDYELAPVDIAAKVNSSLTSSERDYLLELASGVALSRACVRRIVFSQEKI